MEQALLKKICMQYGLGVLESQPVSLQGGFMHKMYSLFTSSGKYAIKLLNPYVMQRETAMENFRIAESLESKLEQSDIPILPALRLHCGKVEDVAFSNLPQAESFADETLSCGRKMQNIDGQYFYLYEWYDGKALKNKEIKEFHCEKIGNLLARIHGLDRREQVYSRDEIHIDWDYYIRKLADKNKELYLLLKDNRSLLYESQEKGNKAIKKIPPVVSICHNDMDSKNVLWHGKDCRIIDLECLSYSSPVMELFELALCWCGYEKCNIDFNLFSHFIHAYVKAGGQPITDYETIYDSNYGRLEWLEYNVKRSMGMECSVEEIEVGVSEVKDTMSHVIYYHDAKEEIISQLRNVVTV